ncbi:MAG: DNA-binding domain-containing protein [Rhodocyclaceae bacterium]|jgi:hypothetical protein|nr:DNA-binding domain-containing protein [Rhodocyclaceae bacterium]
MSAHADPHSDFSAVLLAPTFACPPGLRTWNGSDPEKRFAVYRNNVIVSLVDALADSYPVVQALVGEDFFRAMAGEFVRRSPPRSPVLAGYGEDFAAFVAHFPPAAGLPYLADMARLEWLRVEAWHAADAAPLPAERIAGLLAAADALPQTCFTLHPALRVLTSGHAVVSLWAAHQADDADNQATALAEIDLAQAEAALLVRPALDVVIIPVDPATASFFRRLQAGLPLGVAAGDDVDLAAALGLLIRHGGIVAVARSTA